MKTIIQLNTVDKHNKLYGLETLHPLISIIDLTKATNIVNQIQMNYGLYVLFLKGGKECCDIKHGRRGYDYQEGPIVSFAPGQVVEVNMIKEEVQPRVYGVLSRYVTWIEYSKLRFFSYSVSEALHLSQRERDVVTDCFSKINAELEHPIDKYSKQLIAYCKHRTYYELDSLRTWVSISTALWPII